MPQIRLAGLKPLSFLLTLAGGTRHPPSPASGGVLQRQDTPWPGWDGAQGSSGGSGALSPEQPAVQAPRRMLDTTFPEEAVELGQGPSQLGAGQAGSPPAAPLHGGKPPPPEHSGLEGEAGVGGGSGDMAPPLEDFVRM